jgi:hypothetical protein
MANFQSLAIFFFLVEFEAIIFVSFDIAESTLGNN